MRCIRRQSITESFQLDDNFPIPGLSRGGARIKVCIDCYCDVEKRQLQSFFVILVIYFAKAVDTS